MFNFPTRIPRISRISTPSEFFPVRHSEYRCLQRKSSVRSVRSVWEIKERKRAGWASIRSGRWFDNVEWWTHSWCALGLLRTASCRCAFSCFRCQEARTTNLHLCLQWFRYRPGRCFRHPWFRYHPGWCLRHQWFPCRYPGWYPSRHPGWSHPLTEQWPSSA